MEEWVVGCARSSMMGAIILGKRAGASRTGQVESTGATTTLKAANGKVPSWEPQATRYTMAM